jgi:hypothetical protein
MVFPNGVEYASDGFGTSQSPAFFGDSRENIGDGSTLVAQSFIDWNRIYRWIEAVQTLQSSPGLDRIERPADGKPIETNALDRLPSGT